MNAIVSTLQRKLFNPIITKSQCDDVHNVINHFYVRGEKGKLFTNQTGTGKTFLACGAICAAAALNYKTILIVAPSEKILKDWNHSLSLHGQESNIVTCSGNVNSNSITLMTYASFRQSPHLLHLLFDLLIFDESHYLLMNNKGESTSGCQLMRALIGHEKGYDLRRRLMEESFKKSAANVRKAHLAARERTKVLLLSATPFASIMSVDYAEGVLFKYGSDPVSRGYNTPNARQQFFVDHFGFSMRCGRLTRPGVEVDANLMERKFHDYLVGLGSVSHRPLKVDTDYSRDFISVESAIGAKIDAGLRALREGNYPWLKAIGAGIINQLAQRQMLESVKARAAIGRIRKHLALGRKVVVYHSFHQEKICQPFTFDDDVELIRDDDSRVRARVEYEKFKSEHPELSLLDIGSLKPTVKTFEDAFGNCLGVVNGKISKGKRSKYIDAFNTKNGGIDVLLVQQLAGREGLSLHDTIGDEPRVLIQLGMPTDPVACIQIEGRTRRYRAASNAIYEYFNTGTDFEIQNFARAIAERAETVENLACGNAARKLKESFIYGYLNSTENDPSPEQGVGGLAQDTSETQSNVWDQARSYFYASMKKNRGTKSAEGNDFFATPHPVGLFLVMLAKLKPGSSLLEPSVGTGNIAMWCPNNVALTCIEQSYDLFKKIELTINRRATFKHQSFEDHNIINKYSSVTLNPPFGSGGKLAAEHVKKSCLHLKQLGRVVAIVPDTAQMDKRIDKIVKELRQDGCFVNMIGCYSLPSVTFERAATSVKTKIIVFLRSPEPYGRLMDIPCKFEDFSWCETHEELFTAVKEYAECNLSDQEVKFGKVDTVQAPSIDMNALPVQIFLEPILNVVKMEFPTAKIILQDVQPNVIPTVGKNNQYLLFG
ncbi:MAG: hypothetical protein EOO52_13065 [Gammaproteobacteria bacterium]|nr:MAG: hypothetical protein EOO52_13065 [Gammaproteobacteria bacterium]